VRGGGASVFKRELQAVLEMSRAVRLAGAAHGASAGVQCGTARLARVCDTAGGHCTWM